MDAAESVRKFLKEFTEKHPSQATAAAALGISQPKLNAYLKGAGEPSLKTLSRMAELLKISVASMVGARGPDVVSVDHGLDECHRRVTEAQISAFIAEMDDEAFTRWTRRIQGFRKELTSLNDPKPKKRTPPGSVG